MIADGFQVLNDRCVVEPHVSEETKSAGGIILPPNVRFSSRKGTVRMVGPGRKQDDGTYFPMNIQTGDVAHYVLGAGIDVNIDGTSYLIIPEVEIIAVERAS